MGPGVQQKGRVDDRGKQPSVLEQPDEAALAVPEPGALGEVFEARQDHDHPEQGAENERPRDAPGRTHATPEARAEGDGPDHGQELEMAGHHRGRKAKGEEARVAPARGIPRQEDQERSVGEHASERVADPRRDRTRQGERRAGEGGR
ncbi:MAG: hypothetical protein U0166_17590 [Acidobacteriota bacterium]